ncbi:MAG: glycyl-radical enzyme activating protein [Eubacteriaceae bacterium]|jgi:pyruvate formate lyase activating enzyme|nr:glycyl-radical enzyme activating protein [Eubacteriaceae bacterium]
MEGTVLRIERISPDDGNGLRTVIFLKGCPLRCAWCSTPESHESEPEWYYMQSKCRYCGYCVKACGQNALSVSEDGSAIIRNKEKCINCFRCADACITKAIDVFGKKMTVDEVMKEINKDRLFYFCSNGGITLSGGDVLLQADFAGELLKECRENVINTSAELDMFGDYEKVKKIIPFLNSYFVDLKHMDPEEHIIWTGLSNRTILANIIRAGEEYPNTPMNARVPLIPGVNDSKKNITATAEFCRKVKSCRSLEFLPYHRLGTAKYKYLGIGYQFEHVKPLSEEETEERIRCLNGMDLPFPVKISGKVIQK